MKLYAVLWDKDGREMWGIRSNVRAARALAHVVGADVMYVRNVPRGDIHGFDSITFTMGAERVRV